MSRAARWARGAIVVTTLAGSGAWAAGVEMSDTRPAMGTLLEITVVVEREEQGRRLLEECYGEVARLEEILSNWKASSEVERFNRRAGTGWVEVSEELAAVIELGRGVSEVTDGAFDLTVDAVTRSWRDGTAGGVAGLERRSERPGFEDPEGRLSDAGAGAGARADPGIRGDRKGRTGETPHEGRSGLVGYRGLDCRAMSRTVELNASAESHSVGTGMEPARFEARLMRAGAGIDTGGIAKGWAVDRVVERLRRGGAIAGFVNFGRSSMAGFGDRSWRVLAGGTAVELRDQALSTSESGAEAEIVDPRTGDLVRRSGTVTIVTTKAARAECWSKALLVLAAKEWPELPAGLLVIDHGAPAAVR